MGKRLILLIILSFLTSCALSKRSKETNTSQIEKTEVKKDSSTSIKTNKAINDEVSTQVTTTDDEELDKKVDEILASLNTSKKSGDNSYKFYYDKELRELRAEFKVAQTKDSIANVNNSSNTEKTFEQQIDEYVKKIVIPWWIYLIVVFLLRKQILSIITFFFPQIKALRTFSDVITAPERKDDKT